MIDNQLITCLASVLPHEKRLSIISLQNKAPSFVSRRHSGQVVSGAPVIDTKQIYREKQL